MLAALQETALTYLDRRAATEIPFWAMVAAPLAALRRRADDIVGAVVDVHPGVAAEAMTALPGAGSAPGVTMPSFGVVVDGDHPRQRCVPHEPPVIARSRDDRTMLDLRSVTPSDDLVIIEALRSAAPS